MTGTIPIDRDQRRIDEPLQHVHRIGEPTADHGRCRLELERPGAHRQAAERVPVAVVQQPGGPHDGVVDAAMAGVTPVPLPGQEVDALADPLGEVDDPEDADPRGGELDGERHAVEAAAQLDDRIDVTIVDLDPAVASALAEQAYRPGTGIESARSGDRQRGEHDDRLAGQSRAAIGWSPTPDVAPGLEQAADGVGGRVGDVLAVVDQHQGGMLGR